MEEENSNVTWIDILKTSFFVMYSLASIFLFIGGCVDASFGRKSCQRKWPEHVSLGRKIVPAYDLACYLTKEPEDE